MWERKLKKQKFHINDDDLTKFVHTLRIDNLQDFYIGILEQRVDADAVIEQLVMRSKHPESVEAGKGLEESRSLFTKFVNTARDIASGISILGTSDSFMHQYAKCCNPIPGDEIVGFVTVGEGIKIHRKDCKNILTLRLAESERIVDVDWPKASTADFLVAIHISGKDRAGLLSDVTHAISNVQNTNIRSVNMDSQGSLFDGQIILYVMNTDHLVRIMEKIKKVNGILEVERFLG